MFRAFTGNHVLSLIRALQLTRAALLYFVDLVAQNERESWKSGELAVSMRVPQHHEIRGEDDN